MERFDILSQFTDEARVWIHAFSRTLPATEVRNVEAVLLEFMSQWNTHGQPVNGGFCLLYNKFVILAEDSTDGISGCSIDSSVRVFKVLKHNHGLDALNHNLIHYRVGSDVFSVERDSFQGLISTGQITEDTVVFNNTVRTLGEIRNGLWETKLSNSWHARAFRLLV